MKHRGQSLNIKQRRSSSWLLFIAVFFISFVDSFVLKSSRVQNIHRFTQSSTQQWYKNGNNTDASGPTSNTSRKQPQRRYGRRYRSNTTTKSYTPNIKRFTPIFKPTKIFTKTLIAPPLHKTVFNAQNESSISKSVLLHNEEECELFICGELPITYTNDAQTVERWLYDHVLSQKRDDEYAFVGFDVESVPNVPWRKRAWFQYGPATIQISTPYAALVVHLTSRNLHPASSDSTLKSIYPTSSITPSKDCCCCSYPLQSFLSNPTILKVGSGIDEDMLELYRWNPLLNAKGRFDLGGIGSQRSMKQKSHYRVGLQKMTRAFAGVELVKQKKLSMSDWSRVPLSDKQLWYASRDAWAGAAVMENWMKMSRSSELRIKCDGDDEPEMSRKLQPVDLNINSLGRIVREKERDISDVCRRAKERKKAKLKWKEIHKIHKYERTEEQENKMNRLYEVMKETAPDNVLYFDAETLQLDFVFGRMNE